jgi:hypothetical protein
MRQWAGLTQFVQYKYGWISEREKPGSVVQELMQ